MLVTLDFDGVLAVSDPYVRLAEEQGASEDVAAALDRMTTGDMDYERGLQSVADRLEGLQAADADAALEQLQIRNGASDLLSALHRADHHVAIVSDAPERAIRSCLDPAEFDVDTVVANRLPRSNDALTGRIEGPLVGGRKDEALKELATQLGHNMDQTVAVGDDQRDLPMLQAAGTGIGVDPAPVVEDQCDRAVPTVNRLELWFEEHGVV